MFRTHGEAEVYAIKRCLQFNLEYCLTVIPFEDSMAEADSARLGRHNEWEGKEKEITFLNTVGLMQ